MICVDDINYKAGGRDILRQVSLKAVPGELLAIIGPNGAGKSTLLKALSGELSALKKKVLMNGKFLTEYSHEELARVRAVMSQSFALNVPFTVEEVVTMGRYPYFTQKPSPADLKIIEEALELVKLQHLRKRTYTTLSGGEQQRVQLARVLAQLFQEERTPSSRYLMLDEPVANMDLLHQHTTMSIAKKLCQKGYSVIAVLHDLNMTYQYADRVILLKDGAILSEGKPEQALTEEYIQEAYGFPVSLIRHEEYDCPVVVPLSMMKVSVENLYKVPSTMYQERK